LFTADGTIKGLITVSSTFPYKVGMVIGLSSSTQAPSRFKIKRVISDTQMYVGLETTNITTYSDMSMYLVSDSATVSFSESPRPVIDINEINRQVYQEEPAIALRVLPVDPYGVTIGENNPQPVKTGTEWDEADITRDGDDDIVKVEFSKSGNLVETIDLQYNGEKSVIKVIKT
jgi:hypothetical protein